MAQLVLLEKCSLPQLAQPLQVSSGARTQGEMGTSTHQKSPPGFLVPDALPTYTLRVPLSHAPAQLPTENFGKCDTWKSDPEEDVGIWIF